MTKASTAKFKDMVLEVETAADSGTYTKICGLTSRGINRQHNMATTEVPDCDDESLPSEIQRNVQSSEATISGAGVWAAESHELMLEWWESGAPRSVRIFHANANVGDTEYETGSAYLVSISNQVEKGSGAVTAEIAIEFDGVPARTAKA